VSQSATAPLRDGFDQVDRANASGKQPVIFAHGLWRLDSSWEAWAQFFEEAGYVAVTPNWPNDHPKSIAQPREHPDAFADKSIAGVAAYQQGVVERLDRKPALIGHSFGGLLVQILAGRGLAAVSIAIDPAPSQGMFPLPLAAVKAPAPLLTDAVNRGHAVALTFEQFRYGFANALSRDEARQVYDDYHVARSTVPTPRAAFADGNPHSDAGTDNKSRVRGPMLIISGELDHQVPPAIVHAAYSRQGMNPGLTQYLEIKDRGHSLTIDSGWRDVAQISLDFIRRFVQP
jgi:non-heme chloroperoxidase